MAHFNSAMVLLYRSTHRCRPTPFSSRCGVEIIYAVTDAFIKEKYIMPRDALHNQWCIVPSDEHGIVITDNVCRLFKFHGEIHEQPQMNVLTHPTKGIYSIISVTGWPNRSSLPIGTFLGRHRCPQRPHAAVCCFFIKIVNLGTKKISEQVWNDPE